MKEIRYGNELVRSQVFLRLFHVCFVSFLVTLMLWALLWNTFFPTSYFAMGIWCILPVVLYSMIHWQAKRELPYVYHFQEDCVWIKSYPKHLYWSLWRRQEPKCTCIIYKDILLAKLMYKKANKKSHKEYELVLKIITNDAEYELLLKTSYLSQLNMQGLLLLLSTQLSNFEDPNDLQLCLLSPHSDIDGYIHSIQERGDIHENK